MKSTIAQHFGGKGRLLSYDGLIQDITERKKLEDQLRQAKKMEAIGTLAGGIAHDFNNLLMGIQGNVTLILLDTDSSHHHYERLMRIDRQIQNGAKLTSHLLGFARKGRYEIKSVYLNQLLEEVSDTFGRTRREITIHKKLGQDLFEVEADAGQIEQVLLNLFVNAADAMPGGGDLILKTTNTNQEVLNGTLYDPKPGNYVMLAVTDTGIGMDKETMDRIFEPFFTTKKMGRGTGLGLASAYGIVKAHGGYIDVVSEKGRGTTFNVYLPALGIKVERKVERTEHSLKGNETVLFIDDEETVLEVSSMMLKHLGYSVYAAKGGKEALKIYENNRARIDLVVLDMIMPDMGGGDTYDELKAMDPAVKVLLSSGYSLDSQAEVILKRGCNGFIQKPFNMIELSQKIKEVLN